MATFISPCHSMSCHVMAPASSLASSTYLLLKLPILPLLHLLHPHIIAVGLEDYVQ